MPTSIHIRRSAKNPGGTIPVGINGVVSQVPVGVDTPVGDDVLEALGRHGIDYRLASVPRVPAGYSNLPGTGTGAAYGLNGVVGQLPVDKDFQPTTAQQEVIDHSTVGQTVLVGGGGAPAVGDAIAFAVRNSTAIDPSVTADAGLGIGADGNGWTVDLTFKGISANGNVNIFDGQKVTISVSDPGFDTSGNATTVTRTIKGSIAIRRQYPNNTQRMITAVGSDLKVTFGLDQPIYQATTINSVTIAAGVYPGANAITVPGAAIVNNSTRQYSKPLFGWLNRQRERATGSSFNVEGVAYHRHGRNGQMVACVQYIGKDNAGHTTAVQTVGAPALSSIQTQGNIVEAYKASIPLTALDQTPGSATTTTMPTVDAIVYPWIGDSSAVLTLSVDGYTNPDPRPGTVLKFLNDKTGAYGGAFAYVFVGAPGGTVSTTAATARAAPYPTVAAALAALKVFNNASKGHNDHSGSKIRLMDDGVGGAVIHEISGNAAVTAGLTFTDLEPDPLNTAAVSFRANSASNVFFPTMIAFGAITILQNANGGSAQNFIIAANGNDLLSLEGTTINLTGTTTMFFNTSTSRIFFTQRNTTTVARGGGIPGGTGGYSFTSLELGTIDTVTTAANTVPYCCVGNRFTNKGVNEGSASVGGITQPGIDGGIAVNNTFAKMVGAANSFIGYAFNFTKGFAFVQNVFEVPVGTGGALINIAADGSTASVQNMLDIHNTVVGDRGNRMYTDDVGSIGKKKDGVKMYCLDYSWPIKSDPYTVTSSVTGRVGNWEYAYDVGNFGNVCLAGAANASGTVNGLADPDGVLWQGMWTNPTSDKRLVVQGAAPGTYNTKVTFTNDASYFGTQAGGGDYHLTGVGDAANAAYNRVPVGFATLAYDISGVARKNDGKGAAGAYERTT